MKKRAILALGILIAGSASPLAAIAETQQPIEKSNADVMQETGNTQTDTKTEVDENNSQVEVNNSDEESIDDVNSQQALEQESTQEQNSVNYDALEVENNDLLEPSENEVSSRAGEIVSDGSFTLNADVTDFPNYSVSSYAILGLSGTFTLDESQVSNGEVVKIADISVTSSIEGLEGKLSNQTSTTIKNESGEILGVLSLEGNSLMLTISSDYTLKDNQEKFTFSNSTALKLSPTAEMVSQNADITETITIGESSVDIVFHQQETYDLTTLTKDQVDLQLSSGASGYASSRIYDLAYNQEGLTELQNSNGATASASNLKKGDFQIANTLSSNVIPTSGTIFLATYVASETNSKLQTNNVNGLASLTATSHEKTVTLPLKNLADGLSLQEMKSQVNSGEDATYVSRQEDGSYITLQNISENTLLISEENLRDTTDAPTTFTDPKGDATVEYYSKALNNRATQATAWVNFEYVDPTVVNTVTSDLLNPDSGEVMNTSTKDSLPQDVSVEGQSTVKVHYVDEDGIPLDTVDINHGWPTSDTSHSGEQFTSSSKDFEGYTLNTNITALPNVELSGNDFIATKNANTVDYPKAGNVTNIYYVYSRIVQKAVINYIDDTTGEILKTDTVTGLAGQLINYETDDKIEEYVSQGYKLVSNTFKDGEEKFDSDESTDQVYEVHLRKVVQKAVIHYIDDTTGETLKSDNVTGQDGQDIDYTTLDKIQSYVSQGYILVSNSYKDGEEKFDTDETQDQVFEVHLKLSSQKAIIHYIDDATGEVLKTDNVTGPNGQNINYTTLDKIKDYELKGYTLVSNSFKDGQEKFDTDETYDQVFEVHLKSEMSGETPSVPEVDDTDDKESGEAASVNDDSDDLNLSETAEELVLSSTDTSKDDKNEGSLPQTGQKDNRGVMIIGSIIVMLGIVIATVRRLRKR